MRQDDRSLSRLHQLRHWRSLARRQDFDLMEVVQQATAGDGIPLADLAHLARARRTMEKLDADVIFKEGHGTADSGG